MGVVLSEPPAEAGSACSEFLGDPARPLVAKPTSMWFMLLAPAIFAWLAIIECLPTTRAGWVMLGLIFGPLVAVSAVALWAVYY